MISRSCDNGSTALESFCGGRAEDFVALDKCTSIVAGNAAVVDLCGHIDIGSGHLHGVTTTQSKVTIVVSFADLDCALDDKVGVRAGVLMLSQSFSTGSNNGQIEKSYGCGRQGILTLGAQLLMQMRTLGG